MLTPHQDDDDKDDGFITLDSYVEPRPETSGSLRRMVEDIWSRFRPDADEQTKYFEKLWRIDASVRDSLSPPPACGPLVEGLEKHMRSWLEDNDADQTTRVIVYPPGDSASFLREWAKQHGAKIADPPPDDNDGLEDVLAALSDGKLVVIPELQAWYRRKVGGLDRVRLLLVAIVRSKDKVILGSDGWAWQFLINAIDAHQLLPEAVVFRPFEAEDLHKWLLELVEKSGIDPAITFRSARDGKEVFTDAQTNEDGYFKSLARQSLGIPWVAWSIWRESLFTTKRDELADSIWVREPAVPTMPESDEREAYLILHALLIHDGLDIAGLRDVLPMAELYTTIAMLERARFITEADEGTIRVRPSAYPRVKSKLEDAGYPGDGL